MKMIEIVEKYGVATVTMGRDKVNAISNQLIDQLRACLQEIENDASINALVFTGRENFFSFGFDVPELLTMDREETFAFLTNFTSLYTYMFVFPKAIVGAVNGHAIGGGCMLTTVCDYRIMASEGIKIALNEINIGASVFAGAVAMLIAAVGHRNAEKILLSGNMFDAKTALEYGLADAICSREDLAAEAAKKAEEFAGKDRAPFMSIKNLVRLPIAEEMKKREEASIREFIEIWFTDETRDKLRKVVIRK